MRDTIRLALTGGATGGHLYPLIAIAKEFKKQSSARGWTIDISYIGGAVMNEKILEKEQITYHTIASSKIRKYFSLQNIVDVLKFPVGFFQALFKLYGIMPNVLFSKGGPGSVQVVCAAWLLHIPIVVHESDSIPGRGNRISALCASRIAISFEKAKKHFPAKKTALIGQPIDPDFDRYQVTDDDYSTFHLDKTRKIIVILGGSQGSQKINEIASEAIPEMLRYGQVVHQTGAAHFQDIHLVAQGYILDQIPTRKGDYHPYGFIPHEYLITLLKMADVVISRAGSGSIFEIAAAGIASILVPIPERTAGRHQIENAYEYADVGACVVIEEGNLTKHMLATFTKKILEDAAKNFAKPDAAAQVVRELISLIVSQQK